MMIVLINGQKYKSISYRIGRMIMCNFPKVKSANSFRERPKNLSTRGR